MQHIGTFFRRPESLRIRAAQGDVFRVKVFPNRRIVETGSEIHVGQRRDTLQIRQRRHVHDRQARLTTEGNTVQQLADRACGILRFLHGQRDQIIIFRTGVFRRDSINLTGIITRDKGAVAVFITQLDTHFGTFCIDQTAVPRRQMSVTSWPAISSFVDNNEP